MQIKCPNCQSNDTSYRAKTNTAICYECDHKWQHYKNDNASNTNEIKESNQLDEEQFCQCLADSTQWQQPVLNNWPAPIAHEYKRLKDLLAQASFISALWQFKDVAEILIKFHTVCMYQWLTEYKPDLLDKKTHALIFSTLSMGSWHELLLSLSKCILQNHAEGDDAFGKKLASYFRKADTSKLKETDMAKLLGMSVTWRNQEIGHGAFRLKTNELWAEFEQMLIQLHKNLALTNPWQNHQLIISFDSANTKIFSGADSIRKFHDNNPLKPTTEHLTVAHVLSIQQINQPDNMLTISPLIQAITCSVCSKQDVFMYDSHDQRKKAYFYIDYLAGHKVKLKPHQAKDLRDRKSVV